MTPFSVSHKKGVKLNQKNDECKSLAADYVLSASAYDAAKDTYFPVFGCPAGITIKTAAASVDLSSLGQPPSLTNEAGAAVAMPITLRDVFGNPMAPLPGRVLHSSTSQHT